MKVTEVWVLRNENGRLVPPLDDDGTDVFMAWPTKADAERGLVGQIERGYFDDADQVKVERLILDTPP